MLKNKMETILQGRDGRLEEIETLFTLIHRSRYVKHKGVEESLERFGGRDMHLSSLVLKIARELERRIPA